MAVIMGVSRHLQWVVDLAGIVVAQEQEGLSRGMRMGDYRKGVIFLEISTLTRKITPEEAVQVIQMVLLLLVVVVVEVSEEEKLPDIRIRILPPLEMMGIMVLHNSEMVEVEWERTWNLNSVNIMVKFRGIHILTNSRKVS